MGRLCLEVVLRFQGWQAEMLDASKIELSGSLGLLDLGRMNEIQAYHHVHTRA